MAIDLNTYTPQQQLAAVYILYYDRAPDPAGFQFWESLLLESILDLDPVATGLTLAEIATHFSDQVETRNVYDFFDPDAVNPSALEFLSQVYANLFGRAPDAAGIEFWAEQLELGLVPPGEILLAIMQGAQGTDIDVLNNKLTVALDWHDSAVDAGMTLPIAPDGPERDAAAAALDGVNANPGSVTTALAKTDAYFDNTIRLTSGEDRGIDFIGSEINDTFDASLTQNPTQGGISNTLSSGDQLNGVGGTDTLVAVLVPEFVGGSENDSTEVQPTTTMIENIEIEVRDSDSSASGPGGGTTGVITLDAKDMTDIQRIGSHYSDGDLVVENLTTLDANGFARDTDAITVVMDHTDNFNSDEDASDLYVLFDNDYLLSGETSQGEAQFFLLDQDAELRIKNGQPNEGRLDEIDKNGIRFIINGQEVALEFDGALLNEDNPGEINTHDQFVAALQPALAQAIADGDLPPGTTVTLELSPVVLFDGGGLRLNQAALQDGSFSNIIPGIKVTSGDGSPVTALGYTAPDEITGEFNVFGRFADEFEQAEEPIAVDIELHKVGRGADGGDLVIGGKAGAPDHGEDDDDYLSDWEQEDDLTQNGIADGIEVFNVYVKGAGIDDPDGKLAKPSSVGTMSSTGDELGVVNIMTHPDYVNGSSWASLEVRDGFNSMGSSSEDGDLRLVNAAEFLGDLLLGTSEHIINADSIVGTGGGDVTLYATYTGHEDDQQYSVVTAGGDDWFDIVIDGDAVDAVTEGFSLNMGNGDNTAFLEVLDTPSGTGASYAGSSGDSDVNGVSQSTTGLLMNLDAVSGSGKDYVETTGMGTWHIDTDGNSDTVYINSGGSEGSAPLWGATGPSPSPFMPVVLYKAKLAISVAGFESVVDIDTGDNFIMTEAEFISAFIRAVDQNEEIKQLIEVELGTTDQNAIIDWLINGDNEIGYQIWQPQLVEVGTPLVAGSSQVTLATSDVAGMTRDLTAVGAAPDGTLVADSNAVDTAGEIVGLYGDTNATSRFGKNDTDDYTGQVLFTTIWDADGGTGSIENNSKIDIGTGSNDLVILSANHEAEPTSEPFSAGPGTPGDGGSSNTLIFNDLNAGKVSIVNWFTDGTTDDLLSDPDLDPAAATGAGAQINGSHMLDFTAFLTNRSTTSGSDETSGLEAINVINNLGSAGGGVTLQANSINFLTVDDLEAKAGAVAAGYDFSSLTAAQIKALIESGAAGDANITYAAETVSDGTTPGLVVGTTLRTSIIAVENIDVEDPTDVVANGSQLDDSNHGDYKFFLVTYGVGAEADASTVTVTEIKQADFGDRILEESVTGVTPGLDDADLEPNIVGSAAAGNTNDVLTDI